MLSINNAVLSLLPLVPKFLVRRVAMRYVAGETTEEAIQTVRQLNQAGFTATLDILGENTTSVERARTVRQSYLDLYDIIHGEGLDSTISLKLTHLGLGSDDALARRSLLDLLGKAKEKDNFLRIDMENSPYTDATISLYRQCALRYEGVGLVLQAYLKRTASDMASLLNDRLNVRICKGIYKETPDLAFQDPEEIRLNFIQLVQTALDGGAYVGIATHDRYLIDSLETWIMNKNIPEDRYEFQVLYGVPMKDRLEALLSKGNKVRVYVPYGEEWYQYATRRLQESPKIAGYILKNLFRKN